jgi:hypothetical protein
MERTDDAMVTVTPDALETLNELSTADVLVWSFEKFHPRLALACSFQAEESVLIDMIYRERGADFRLFTLDTGRLNQETYDCMDAIRDRYGVEIEFTRRKYLRRRPDEGSMRRKEPRMSRWFSHRDSSVLAVADKNVRAEQQLVYAVKILSGRGRTETEKFILHLLDRSGAIGYEALVWRLSSFLYQREAKIGGWALDIGVFGASLFVSEARREVESGKGILWEIDSPREDSDELLSNLSRNERPTLPGDRRRDRRGA